jgi:hypothetical protein
MPLKDFAFDIVERAGIVSHVKEETGHSRFSRE